MATVDEIKKTILKVAGNPVSGSLVALAAQMAQEIHELDQPGATRGKQKRVVESMETRVVDTPSEEPPAESAQ
jgi:hypothetical protein